MPVLGNGNYLDGRMAEAETSPEELFDLELFVLETLSNGALDLIRHGLLDEAERVCRDLRGCFPDSIDWIERTAELHEARGRVEEAVEHYRLCLAYIDRHPEDFDPESRAWYRERIERLHATGR